MRWAGEGAGAPRITHHRSHRPLLIPCTWVVVPAGLMGRGRSRGGGDTRITRHGIHRPMLIARTWVVVPSGLIGRGRSRGVGAPRITPRLPLHFVCCDVVPVDVLAEARA